MHTVREFCEHAFAAVGLPVEFTGEGVDEKGICAKTGRTLIAVSPNYFRPAEVEELLGNPAKAKRILGWEPKVTFRELVTIMAAADWELAKREAAQRR
jgi:GDPmannose 4,6-dehydratase